jgi:chaperonin cofactor prefoldin
MFKKIVSMNETELKSEMETLKESLNTKIDSLLTESDSELRDKLTNVKNDVNESVVSKYNYFRLTELMSNLD